MTILFIVLVKKEISSSTCGMLQQTEEIADIINTVSFGTPDKPGRYTVPFDKNTDEIGDVSFND
jgi:hypothetical protein